MIRRRTSLLFLLVLLVLSLAATMAWVLRTESGARWIWSQASAWVPGSLTAGSINGDLRSGLNFQGLMFANESTSVEAGNMQLQLAFGLFPPAVSVRTLTVDQVTIRSLMDGQTKQDNSPEASLTALALPLPIDFERVRLDQLLVLDTDGTTQFEADSVTFSGHWYERLTIQEARLGTLGMQWQVVGKLGLQTPFPVEATVNSQYEPATDDPESLPALDFTANFKGVIADLEAEVNLLQPATRLQGHIRNLLTEPAMEVQLAAGHLTWPLRGASPDLALRALVADISGNWNEYQLKASGSLELGELSALPLTLVATGTTQGMRVEKFFASGDLAELTASGALSWTDNLQLQLHSVIDRFDLSPWLADWPADHPAKANLDLSWKEGGLTFQNIELEAMNSAFRLQGNGILDLEQDITTAELGWQSLQWPIGSGQPLFTSEHGKLSVSGRPNDWTASGQVQIQTGEWPAGQIILNAKGDLQSVQLQIGEGQVLGGNFAGEFDYRWTDNQPWSAIIRADQIDISSLTTTFPGVISANLQAKGQAEPQNLEITIVQLNGQIRDQPVEAKGQIAMTAGAVSARDLQIRSGQSHLHLDGAVADRNGIYFSGHVESLADFIEDATGTITGEGRFSNQPDHPRIELDLQGKDLSWQDLSVAAIAVTPGDKQTGESSNRIALTGVKLGETLLEELSVTLSGERPLDHIAIEARKDGTQLQASLTGTTSNWKDLALTAWKGTLDSMRVSDEPLGSLELEQPAELAFSTSSLELGTACYNGSRNGRGCIEANWRENEHLAAAANMDNLSLRQLELFLGSRFSFSQRVTGTASWEIDPGSKPTGKVQLEVSPGELTSNDEEPLLQTGPGLFSFEIKDGQLQLGNLDFSLPGVGTVDTDFSAPDISQGIDSPVQGRLQLDFSNIAPLLPFVPAFDAIAGSVNANVVIAGTLAQPKLTGFASLVRGRIEHHASGVVLSDIKLAGAVYEFDYTELNGSFTSGDGRGEIKAAVDFGDLLKPTITMELSGKDLTLLSVPDMTVIANPDLRVRYQDSMLNLDGSILIPSARISPRYLPTTSASESEDLIIVGGEKPEIEESFINQSRLKLNGSVAVELGENITVTLERATARLHGKAVFNWDNNLLPIADGTYLVSGKITAYGQLLEVSDGRVSFPHVPANNPRLNIRAEREIYGNMQVKQAGVLISGTLKHPVLEPYTTPMTTKERALTLLVTGSDFNYEQGVGAVEVGMYIAPKLYVSYGIGLFDSQSVISARYDLKRGFGIKATSGQRATGVDMSYTIEH